jgi:hypothetical protein
MIHNQMIWIKNPKKIDKLPTDLLIVIFSYLNIEDIDILTARIVCTSFNGILSLELSLNKYPKLYNSSFFKKCVRTRIFNEEMKWRHINTVYEKKNFNMLIDGNWL